VDNHECAVRGLNFERGNYGQYKSINFGYYRRKYGMCKLIGD
jgi:hypothetical protein